MSDGKTFGQVQDLSPEERLTEVERKFSVIIERIKAYDKIIDDFQYLKTDLEEISQTHSLAIKNASDALKEQKAQLDTLQKSIDNLSMKNANVGSILQGYKENLHLEQQRRTQDFEYFSHILADLEKKIPVDTFTEKISALAIEYHTHLEQCDLNFRTFSGHDERQSRRIGDLEQRFHDLKNQFLDKNIFFEKIDSLSKSYQEALSLIFPKVQESLQKRESQFRNEMDTKLEAMKQETIASILPDGSMEERLSKRMEAISLEGANAYLKSNNNAQQILLLEKKIENLTLLLKKYELNK